VWRTATQHVRFNAPRVRRVTPCRGSGPRYSVGAIIRGVSTSDANATSSRTRDDIASLYSRVAPMYAEQGPAIPRSRRSPFDRAGSGAARRRCPVSPCSSSPTCLRCCTSSAACCGQMVSSGSPSRAASTHAVAGKRNSYRSMRRSTASRRQPVIRAYASPASSSNFLRKLALPTCRSATSPRFTHL
jgi:hypothetical protein